MALTPIEVLHESRFTIHYSFFLTLLRTERSSAVPSHVEMNYRASLVTCTGAVSPHKKQANTVSASVSLGIARRPSSWGGRPMPQVDTPCKGKE